MSIPNDFYKGQYPFDASVFAPSRPSDLNRYRVAWDFFESVVVFNNEARIRRLNGEVLEGLWGDSEYYIFATNEDKKKYILGQQLHIKAYPEIIWKEQANI
jgi:hypothetical protein